MADRVDFYFRQRVTEAELDLAFSLLEQADRDLAADIGIQGVISGAVPTQHLPVPDLSVDLTSPAKAYDQSGRRIFVGTDQTVDCSLDLVGVPTAVTQAGHVRWIAIFLRFTRQLSDPRTDGNAQQVYFRRDEAYELVVRQAPEGLLGAAQRVALPPQELLLCDIQLTHGQTQILNANIDLGRRQAFVFAQGDAVAVESGAWSTLAPAVGTVQSALDEVDDELSAHFSGSDRRHPASDIDWSPSAFLASTTVQAALSELLSKLTSTSAGAAGSSRIGAQALPGIPHALAASSVDSQIASLLNWLNTHEGAPAGAHAASAISAAPHESVSATSVQGQLEEIVSDLKSNNPTLGTALIGNAAVAGAPYSFTAGTVRAHLTYLLGALNTHVGGGGHDGRYWLRTETVDNADTVDGQHASDFASASHLHDARYMRRLLIQSIIFDPGETKVVTTLDVRPDLVTYGYNYLSGGAPQSTTYVQGVLTSQIRSWVTKIPSGGDKDYEVSVQNGSASQLYITVGIYRVGP